MEEFEKQFLEFGFPDVYDNITDFDVIKGFYERD
jgi:hypothetical protein